VWVDRADVLDEARLWVGAEYGFLTIASIVTTMITPISINVMKPGTLICSALAALALHSGGLHAKSVDYYQDRPSQVFNRVQAALIEPNRRH